MVRCKAYRKQPGEEYRGLAGLELQPWGQNSKNNGAWPRFFCLKKKMRALFPAHWTFVMLGWWECLSGHIALWHARSQNNKQAHTQLTHNSHNTQYTQTHTYLHYRKVRGLGILHHLGCPLDPPVPQGFSGPLGALCHYAFLGPGFA